MSRTILRGARTGDIAFADGVITDLGTIEPAADDTVIDVEGDIVTAGLVNTHHHLYQWMTRGHATGCDLFEWLTTLYPVWGRMDADDVHAAAVVGLAELAMSGCTTAFDHHYVVPRGDDSVFDMIVEAARTVGVRLHLSRGSMDLGERHGGLPPDHLVEDRDAILASTARIVADHHDGDMVHVVVAPCSPFSVTSELMVESAAFAREHGLRLHTHLCETIDEQDHCLERFGRRPVDQMAEWGWIDGDVWLAHGIHLSDAEITSLGKHGTGVAHCPSSNARLAAGMCPVVPLRHAGAPVGLGVDGVASNEVGGLFPELRQALYTARLREAAADALMPDDVVALATQGGAACLGRTDIGTLEVGKAADIAVWPGDRLGDIADPMTGLVMGPDQRVRHLFVGGEHRVADGELLGVDLAAAHRTLATRAARLWV